MIAIIAILAAILFPVFAQAKLAAKATSCASNLRQLNISLVMYEADADDRFPLSAYGSTTKFYVWHDLIDPYVKNKQVWWCDCSSVKKTDANGSITSHFGYNTQYITNLKLDFSNLAVQTAISSTQVNDPANTLVLSTAKSSKKNSWCGDDGKFMLPPSMTDADCWGRPDPNAIDNVVIAWVDGHVSRKKLTAFYTGQSPVDKYFDLE